MDQREKNAYILITDWEVISRLKKFLRAQKNVAVLALDEIISYNLTRRGIPNTCLYDLISREEEKNIFEQAMKKINDRFNELMLRFKSENEHWLQFFDGMKLSLRKNLYEIYYYRNYYACLWQKIQPEKIYYYYYPANQLCRYLSLSLNSSGIAYEALPLGALDKIKLKLSHAEFFLDDYLALRNHRPHNYATYRVNYKKNRHNKKVISSDGAKGNNAIFSTFLYNRDFSENLKIIKQLKNKGLNPILITHRRLAKSVIASLAAEKTNYLYISFPKKENKLPDIANIAKFVSTVTSQLFPNGYYDDKFRWWWQKKFNFSEDYTIFTAYDKFIKNIIEQLQPQIFLGLNTFSLFTRVGLATAKRQGIKTASLVTAHESNDFYYDLVPPNSGTTYEYALPDDVYLTGNELSRGYRQKESIIGDASRISVFDYTGPKDIKGTENCDGTVKNQLLKKLHLPAKAKLIIFAGQPLFYNFSIINELIAAFLKLQKNDPAYYNCYLLLRPHPFELRFFYNWHARGHQGRVLVDKTCNLKDTIISSEYLMTYSSFSAIESLAWRKPVLLLDFLHKTDRPSFYSLDGIKIIDKISDLAEAMHQIMTEQMASRERLPSILDRYFQPHNDSSEINLI